MTDQAPPVPPRLEDWIERLEAPLLGMAALSIALYLGNLKGLWAGAGLARPAGLLEALIDAAFLADLLLKARVLGKPYLRSPWFFIDLVSTLPLLRAAAAIPESLMGLRAVRVLRSLRLMRSLRLLRAVRTLRVLRFLKTLPEGGESESRTFDRALYATSAAYAAAFLGLMASAHGKGFAAPEEIEFYVVLSSLLGMGLILAVVRFQMPELASSQMRMLLDIALPRQVARHCMLHPERYDVTVRMPATIVFTDLRGFTRMVEGLGENLGELKLHLETVMDKVVEIHLRHDLIVDKFIGDAVMSFRGGPLVEGEPPEHAYRVVRAAVESLRAVRELGDPMFSGMKIGGASTADCLIGAFGTSRRLSYTALGDAVNLAARLEPASGRTGTGNLFCEATFDLTKDRSDLAWRRFGRMQVEGKDRSVGVYEAFDAGEAGGARWLARFEEGLRAFEARRFELAKRLFEETERARPGGDGAAAFYLRRLEELARGGVPEGWEPVVRTAK